MPWAPSCPVNIMCWTTSVHRQVQAFHMRVSTPQEYAPPDDLRNPKTALVPNRLVIIPVQRRCSRTPAVNLHQLLPWTPTKQTKKVAPENGVHLIRQVYPSNGNKAVENYPADTSYFTTAPPWIKLEAKLENTLPRSEFSPIYCKTWSKHIIKINNRRVQ